MPEVVFSLNCSFTGNYSTEDAAKQARDLIVSNPERYLRIVPWDARRFELNVISFKDEDLEQEILTTT